MTETSLSLNKSLNQQMLIKDCAYKNIFAKKDEVVGWSLSGSNHIVDYDRLIEWMVSTLLEMNSIIT